MTRPSMNVPTARIVAVLVALVALVAQSGCAATARESEAPVYLVNNTTVVQVVDGSTVDWNTDQGVVLSAVPVPAVPTDFEPLAFPAPTNGALDASPFISPKGSERNKGAWKLWGDFSPLNGKGALLPSVCPGCLINGNPTPVKDAGGTYSMGIAYLKDNDQTVVSAFFTTITIEAGSGAWKFDTPTR